MRKEKLLQMITNDLNKKETCHKLNIHDCQNFHLILTCQNFVVLTVAVFAFFCFCFCNLKLVKVIF